MLEISDFLNDFSVLVTVVSSLVAIAAVSICAILTAVITQRGARKLKKSEMLFREMVTAYYDFLRAVDDFTNSVNQQTVTAISETSARAMLFASPETQELIAKYASATQAMVAANLMGDKDKALELSKPSGEFKADLLKSMQKDLKKR